MERMLVGVATRRYARVNEPVGDHLDAQLEARWPDAAASLREGLEDRFTVRRLGVGGRLAASLSLRSPVTSKL
jgi:hypothetical protein